MAERGGFKRKAKGGLPATVPEVDNLIAQVSPVQLTGQATSAFYAAFSALYEQAEIEAQRLARLNPIIRKLEDELLSDEVLDGLTPRQKADLWNALLYSSRGSTQVLMEISKTIMNSRATATILANLRRIAMSYENGGHGPAPVTGGSVDGEGTVTPSNGNGKMASRFSGR